MKVPKKGQEKEPGAGARTVPSYPLQSRRVGQQEPPPVPFPSRAAELGVAAQQERGLRSPPTIPAVARLHRAAQAAARPPRGLRVRARHLRPPPSVPRGARPGGSSLLPRPCPPKLRGHRNPGGICCGSPEGRPGPVRREQGTHPRAPGRLPALSPEPGGRGWARSRCPVWPRVGGNPRGSPELGMEREGCAALRPGDTLLQRVTFLHGPRPRAQTRQRLI